MFLEYIGPKLFNVRLLISETKPGPLVERDGVKLWTYHAQVSNVFKLKLILLSPLSLRFSAYMRIKCIIIIFFS